MISYFPPLKVFLFVDYIWHIFFKAVTFGIYFSRPLHLAYIFQGRYIWHIFFKGVTFGIYSNYMPDVIFRKKRHLAYIFQKYMPNVIIYAKRRHAPHTMHTSSETSPKHSTVVRFATFGGVGNEEDDVELQQQGGGGAGGRIDEEAQPRLSTQNDDNNNAVGELSGASSIRESRSGRTARADETMVWSDPSTWFIVRKTGPDGKQTVQRSRTDYWNPCTTITNSPICGPRHNFFAWYCNPVVEQEFLLFYYNDRRSLISGGINYIVISILWLVLTILNKHVNTLVVVSVAVLVPLFLVLVVMMIILKRRIDAMNDAQRKQLEDEGRVPAAFALLDAHDVARNEMRRNAKMFEIACCLVQLVECVAVLIYASFRSECFQYPQANHQKTCLNAYVSDVAALFIGFLWTQSRPARSFVLGPVMILFLAVLLGGRFLPIQLGVNWNQYYTVLISYVTFFLAAWYGSRNRENWLRDAFERRVMLLAAQQQLFTLRAQLAALSLGSAASNNAPPRAIQSAAPSTTITAATQSPQPSSIQQATVHSCLIAVIEWENYHSWSAHQRNASVALSAWQQFVTAVETAAKADLGSDVATSLQISALPYEGVVVVALPLLEGAASSTTVSQWFYCASTWASGLTAPSASSSGCCCSCDSGSSSVSSSPLEATVRVALHIGETQWNGSELTGPAVSAAKRLLPSSSCTCSSSSDEEEEKASLGATSVSPHHQLLLSVGPTRTAADAQFLGDLYQSASTTRAIRVSATLALLARPLLLSPNSAWVSSTASASSDSETGSPLGLNNSQSGNPLLGKGGEASFGSRDGLLTPTGLYVGTPAGGEDSINGTPQKGASSVVVVYPALCHGVVVGLFQVCPEAVAPRTTQQQQKPEPQQPQPQPQATAVMSMTSGDEGVAFHHTSAKLDDGHEPSPKPSLPHTSDTSKVQASSSATNNATAVRKGIQLAVEEHDSLMDIPFNPCCERVPRYADPAVEEAYQAWYPESYQFGFVLCTYVVQIAASFTIVISMRVLDKVSSASTIWDSYPWALASLLLPSWMLLLNVLFGERVPRLAVTLAQLAHYALYTIAVFAAPKGTVVGNSVAGWFFSLHLIANQNRARWYSAKLHFLMHSLFLTAFFFWILFKAKDPGESATVLGLALVGFSWFMSIRGIIFIDGIIREGFTVVVALQRFLSRIATERQVLGQTLLAHAAAVFPSSVGTVPRSSPTVLTIVGVLVAPSSAQLSPQSLFRRISQDSVAVTTTSDPNDSLPPQKSAVADFIRSPSMRRLLLIVERRGATTPSSSSSLVELMQTAINSNASSTASPSSPSPSPSILPVPLDETKVALLALNMTPDTKRAFDDIAGRVLQMTMTAAPPSDSWIVVVSYDAVALELHVPGKRFLLAGPAVSVGLALLASSPSRVDGSNGGCSTSEESPCARFVCTDAASRVLQLAQDPKEDDSSSTTSLRGVLASLRRNNDAKPKVIDEWNLGKRFPTTKVLMY
jgi:hypothetical protein